MKVTLMCRQTIFDDMYFSTNECKINFLKIFNQPNYPAKILVFTPDLLNLD